MFLVIVLVIVAVTLAILLPMIQYQTSLSKWSGSTITTESFDTTDVHYNSLGATQTANSLNRLISVTDPTGSSTNAKLQAAMSTPTPSPGGGGITGTKVSVVPTSAAVPGRNAIAAQASFCEKQSGIGSCAMLDDPTFANVCGVCIKNGTKSMDTTPGQWVGGLYISNEDRSIATTMKVDPQPTAGGCPIGYFFLDRASCDRGVNRMQCKDAGIVGGWSGPSGPIVDAKCAQVIPGGPFVYDTKNRSFLANIKFIVPGGTGLTKVALYRMGSDGSRGKQIGAMEVNKAIEGVITTWEPVVEGDSLQLEVVQEFATHMKGSPEVYAVSRGGYNLTQNTAADLCKTLGARLATTAEVENAHVAGADWCFAAHVSDASPRFPTQVPREGCGEKAVNVWGSENKRAGATCYGIKPSINDDYSATNTTVFPFTDQPTKRESRFGRIQRGVRGFLAQWENTYDPVNAYKTAIPFEGTVSSDTKRLGSFSNSGLIASPRARDFPKFLSNQYWIWSGTNQTAIFRCKVPATFLPPTYKEDIPAVAGKPLLSQRSSLTAGKISPCTTPPYSAACLISLFTAAGGDGAKGTLSPTIGGVAAIQELQKGSEDAISNYVSELYGIATTGLLPGGSLASRAVVNQAAMKLFGFEIASPCEEIVAGSDGSVGLVPKEAPISPECMDFLYRNAGKEGFEGSVQSKIPATYISIGDRYSGIRKGEYGVTKQQLIATPFQTCTPKGTIAPMKGGRVDSKAVQKITSSTDGSIEGIQGFFNRIFQLANTDGSQDTLAACFGITPTPMAMTVMFQSKNYPTRYITSKGMNPQVRLEEGISVISIRQGIGSGTVSFGPFGQSNYVFRHSGFVLYTNAIDGSDLQKKDSSFRMVPGLADPTGVSFQSYNYPDRYLRHSGFAFYLQPNTGGIFAEDATFYKKIPPSTLTSRDWVTIASAGNWILDPGPNNRLKTIAVGDDNSVIGTSPFNSTIWTTIAMSGVYTQIQGNLLQVDAKSKSLCVGVGLDNNVYQQVNGGTGWQRIGVRAKWVSIGSDGTIVCVNSDVGSLWRYLGSVDQWENIPGNQVAQISVGNRNNMWCVNVKDQIFKWSGNNWATIPGALTRVAISSGGKVAGVNRQGNIWIYSNAISDWKQISGDATNISISESYIAATNSDSKIYYLKL
jgi:hypothetical protein